MKIDPTEFAPDHPLSVAMRSVSRYWMLAYSKLLSLEWRWSTATRFGQTDGAVLELNPESLAKLAAMPKGVDYITFLLVHESLHALLGHGWRLAKMADGRTANIAADYIINAMIVARNRELKREVFPLISGVLIDEALSGDKSVEQLYRELLKPQPPAPKPEINPNPDTNDKQDQCDTDGDPDGADQDNPDEGDDGHADPDDDGAGETETGGEPDDPGDIDDGGADPGDGDAEGDGPADGGAGEDDSDDDDFDLSQFPGTGVEDNMAPEPGEGQSAAEAIDKIEADNDRLLVMDSIERQTMGTSGATGIRAANDRGSRYQMDWTDLLREWLLKHSNAGWNSPFNAAIFSSTGLVAAGRRQRSAGVIVWVLDTSGSIPQTTYQKFLGEAQLAIDELKPEETHLLSVSHRVCFAAKLEPGDLVPLTMPGGGGTAFQPAFDWVRDNDVEPDVLVYLTDGLSPDRDRLQDPGYPVLWLSTLTKPEAYPIGEVVGVAL